MPVTIPPVAPNRTNPETFSPRMDDFLAWMVIAVPEFNALALATGPGTFLDGTVTAPSITFSGDTNTGFFHPIVDTIAVAINGVEALRVNSAGGVYMGSPNAVAGIGAARLQTQGITAVNATWSVVSHSTSAASGSSIAMGRSRGTAVDSYTIVAAADNLGVWEFWGADGATMILGGYIRGYVIGTPALGDVRAGLQFYTGSGPNTTALRLSVTDTQVTSTLPYVAPAGTAAAPTYTFTGDLDMGMYDAGVDILGFSTAGLEAFRVNATQQTLFGANGFGYIPGNGAGGAVTQITSRTTGVTLNTIAGDVTLFGAVGSATPQSFTITNSKMAINDNVILSQRGGLSKYAFHITNRAAGSFEVTFYAMIIGASDTPVLHFDIIKSTIT